MGDTVIKDTTGKQMLNYAKYLPSYLRATGQNIGPFEQSLVNARSTIDPQNLALDESLLRYFGPRMNEIGSQLQRQNALNQSSNELAVLEGPGRDMALAGQRLNEEIDPEYYASRRVGAEKLIALLQGQDPNSLTGAEMANIERGLNRTNRVNGVADVGSSQGAISNAMTFGEGLDRKRNTLVNTLSVVPQNLAAMKSGFDAFQVATGRPSSPNVGQQQFQTGRQGFGSNVMSMGQGLMGEAGQNVRQFADLTANRRDALDRAAQVAGSLPSC